MGAAVLRCLRLAATLFAVASCSGHQDGTVYRIGRPLADAREGVRALAACPSPLKRLGIASPQPRIEQSGARSLDLIVLPKGGGVPMVIHFRFHSEGKDENAPTRIETSLDLPDAATELDLGDGRLITPHSYPTMLFKELENYFNMLRPEVTPKPSDAALLIAAECRKFGRLLDDGAILISPSLAREIARQKRRDAINWLFKDDYQLRTDNDERADWADANDGYPDN